MCIFPTTIKKHPRRQAQRGSIALIALTALVIVFVIGLGLLTLGSNARLSGKRAMRLGGAQALASSGVEYGYWQRVQNAQPLPYTGSRSLGSGSFAVAVTDNSATIAGTVKIVSTGTQNGNSVKLTRILSAGTPYTGTPYTGTPISLSATASVTMQVENYDKGGAGVAYSDTDPANRGGQYRTSEGVDIETCADTGGGYDVCYIQPTEWMKYTVNVPIARSYLVSARIASLYVGMGVGAFHIEDETGNNLTGPITVVSSTANGQTWSTIVASKSFTLTTGQHVLRVYIDSGSGTFNLNSITFN